MKLPMKLLRTAGLCLASMLVMCVAITATASAAPVWEQCTKGPVNAAPTKYTESGCSTLNQTTGEWNWREVNGTEKVIIKGSVNLKDTGEAAKSEVECYTESEAVVGPKNVGATLKVTIKPENCRGIKNCEKVVEIEAVHLLWGTELTETSGKVIEILKSGTGGEPGWKVKCKAAGVNVTDECLAESGKPESLLLENKNSSGELLVLATFQHLRKAKCSIGGPEKGEVTGSLAVLQANKTGLKVS